MANHYFKFKQFTVFHDRCAMKVGTDGVLLGAWACADGARRVLDIGTGTGLIALMLAQRFPASVTGVDIDGDAVLQARENVSASPWAGRIDILQQDVRLMEGEGQERFGAIVSNPPYFTENVPCPDGRRDVARHAGNLTFDELLQAVSRLLAADGQFSVVLPAGAADDFITNAAVHHLYLHRKTLVHTKPDAVPKRVLMAFGRQVLACETGHIAISLPQGAYTPEYVSLVKDFYLNL